MHKGISRNHDLLDKVLDQIMMLRQPEGLVEPHLKITKDRIAQFLKDGKLQSGQLLLDIDCRGSLALQLFDAAGLFATGIAITAQDMNAALLNKSSITTLQRDPMFLGGVSDQHYDWIWARHVLQACPMPSLALNEWRRVLKPSGLMYVEVPAPDTALHHEFNPNNYAVMGRTMWMELFQRASFTLLGSAEMLFKTPVGKDCFWSFLLQKVSPLKG